MAANICSFSSLSIASGYDLGSLSSFVNQISSVRLLGSIPLVRLLEILIVELYVLTSEFTSAPSIALLIASSVSALSDLEFSYLLIQQ